VVDPGLLYIAIKQALHYVCPVILTPETRGHVCQISSPHSIILKRITNLKELAINKKKFNKYFESFEDIQIFV
jgi:hypothetical protein